MIGERVIIGNAELWCGDCREILPGLPKHDLLLTDPPYGINRSGQPETFTANAKHKRKSHADFGWDESRPEPETFAALLVSSRTQIIWGGNYFADLLPPTMGWMYWDKGQNGLSMSDGELAWSSMQKALRSFVCNRSSLVGSAHPTQKPEQLMRWCINQAGDPLTVIDCYMGSGTTGVACAQLGKVFTGIERERKYFDIACERISRAQAQGQMFVAPVVKPVQGALLMA